MIKKTNWTQVKFGDVVRLNTDRITDPAAEGIERYVGLDHIEPEDLRIRRWGLVAEGITFTNYFKPGQTLFGKRRAYQRKIAVADFEGVCSGDIYVFEPKDDCLLPELLPFVCQTERFYEYAIGTSAGSLSPRTNWTQLAQYEFALPPLAEQSRMATLLNGVERALEEIKNLQSRLEQLRKSFIVNTFSHLTKDSSTSLVRVEDAGEVLMGRQRAPQYDKGISPRPYLRVANVFDGYINITDVKEMDFSDDEFDRYKLNLGDVLLNEGQSRELVGRSSIFRGEVSDCCFQNTPLRFRPFKVSSEYAHHYFQFCLYTGRFAEVSKQTTSIAHLGANRFVSMRFPLVNPEIESYIVNNLMSIENNLKRVAERKSQLEQVKSATLGRELSS